MQKVILVILAIVLTSAVSAQGRNSNPGDQSATAIKQGPVANGDVLFRTLGGKYKIYATYVNSSIAGYYALDMNGKKIPVVTEVKTSLSDRTKKCYRCFKVVDTVTGVSTQDCTEITCPKSVTGKDANTKSDKTPGRAY